MTFEDEQRHRWLEAALAPKWKEKPRKRKRKKRKDKDRHSQPPRMHFVQEEIDWLIKIANEHPQSPEQLGTHGGLERRP